LLGTICIF